MLEMPYFRNMRFRNQIQSKKGRHTPYKTLFPHKDGGWADVWMDDKGFILKSEDSHIIDLLKDGKVKSMMFETIDMPEVDNNIISRFLAKAALESFAIKIPNNADWLGEIIENEGLNSLRDYARFGRGKHWEYHQRRIYSEEDRFSDPVHHPEPYEVLHELDFLVLEPGIYYYALVIMGVEYVINCGASELELYKKWLEDNNNISPIIRGTEYMINRDK